MPEGPGIGRRPALRETARLSPPEPSASDGFVSSDRQLFPAASLYPKSLLGRTRRSRSPDIALSSSGARSQSSWYPALLGPHTDTLPSRRCPESRKGQGRRPRRMAVHLNQKSSIAMVPIGLSKLSQPSNNHRSECKSVICFSRVSEARAHRRRVQ
jgi:hypothetical protein